MAALAVGLRSPVTRSRQGAHLRLVPLLASQSDEIAAAPIPRSSTRLRRAPFARLLPGLVVAGLLAGTWLGASALTASRPAPAAGVAAPGAALTAGERYVVHAGDTLWGIAVRLDPAGDPRPLVDALGAQVHGGTLEPGEVLVLP